MSLRFAPLRSFLWSETIIFFLKTKEPCKLPLGHSSIQEEEAVKYRAADLNQEQAVDRSGSIGKLPTDLQEIGE